MRQVLLVATLAAALSAACGGGTDDSATPAMPVGSTTNNTALDQADTPLAPDNDTEAAELLPSTASPLPIVAAAGILCLVATALAHGYRRQHDG